MNLSEIDFSINVPNKILYGDDIIFIGSCFSEEIGQKCMKSGLKTTINPYGVIFHPLAISYLLNQTISESEFQTNIFSRDDVYLDWMCSSSIYAMESLELKNKLLSIKEDLKKKLKNAKFLIITFGTSYAYYLNDQLVSNCHKMPKNSFSKRLSSMEEFKNTYAKLIENLRDLNKELIILTTVSPVRHSKDGFIENNRSKARLMLFCEWLEKKSLAYYLPSYEIVIDLLRDYKYFKADGVHPNEYAIDKVWDFFKSNLLNPNDLNLLQQVEKYQKERKHKLIHPESKRSKEFLDKLDELKKNLLDQNPLIQL